MSDQERSLSSLRIKTEVLYPQPEKACLITSGIGSFPTSGELLDVQEVVKNFENSSNDSLVTPKTEMIPNSSTVIDQLDPPLGAQSTEVTSNLDPRKMRRLLANRVSAQRARQRKLEYIEYLKRDIETGEARLSVIAPQLSFHEVERVILRKENNALKEMLKALTHIRLRKEAEYESLKEELKVLNRAPDLSPKDEK